VARLGALLLTLTLTALACGAPTTTAPRRVYDVQVDAKATPFSLAAGLYFPKEVQARAGDTIRFIAVDRGEFHTVTLGALVDAALETLARVPAGRTVPSLESLKLPAALLGSPPVQVGQAAAQPCFIDSGAAPSADVCPKEQQRQPELTGTQGLFNSGYLPGAAVFAVRLSDSIKPGTYGFLCLLHGPQMSGRIVIVEKDRPVPEPAEVKARGAAELDALVRSLQPLVDSAPRGLPTATVVAGVPAPVAHTQATVFAPAEVTVRKGEPVTWNVFGPHTISFNAPQDAVGTVIRASDGSWSLNPRMLAPEGPARRSETPGGPITLESGAWDGRGFRNSGLIVSAAPRLVSYKVAFSEPGTYSYKCLLHPDMEGRVKVGD